MLERIWDVAVNILAWIWDVGTDILFWYTVFLIVAAVIKALLRIYYPIEKRRYIVSVFSEEFSAIYREPAFVAQYGFFFKSQAWVKGEELEKKGLRVLVHRNLEKLEEKETSNGLDSKYTCEG